MSHRFFIATVHAALLVIALGATANSARADVPPPDGYDRNPPPVECRNPDGCPVLAPPVDCVDCGNAPCEGEACKCHDDGKAGDPCTEKPFFEEAPPVKPN